MNREEQRQLGVLVHDAQELFSIRASTYPATVYASADLMEHLVLQGGQPFKDYDAKTRRRMASEGRAMPDGSFPIADCSDAADAIRSVGRAKPGKRAAVESHIRKRVRALSCTGSIYENWK